MTHDGNVKLAGVGVAKHEKDITGGICGTSLYLAPEVFEGRIYSSKADMYSFGFVLWELWYGKTAFEDTVVSTSQSVLLEDVRRGLRPTHMEQPRWNNPATPRMERGHGIMLENEAKSKVNCKSRMGMF